jgi:hypothetical protein
MSSMQENPLDRGGWKADGVHPETPPDRWRKPNASVLAYVARLALLLGIAAAATLLLDALYFVR